MGVVCTYQHTLFSLRAMSLAFKLKALAGSAAACGTVYVGLRYLSDKPVSVLIKKQLLYIIQIPTVYLPV